MLYVIWKAQRLQPVPFSKNLFCFAIMYMMHKMEQKSIKCKHQYIR